MSANLENFGYKSEWKDFFCDSYEGYLPNMSDYHMHEYYEISLILCGNVKVLYTKESQTADAYIEKTSKELVDRYTVRVVTSDLEQQYIVLGNGALRVSAKEFRREIENTTAEINETIEKAKYLRKQ